MKRYFNHCIPFKRKIRLPVFLKFQKTVQRVSSLPIGAGEKTDGTAAVPFFTSDRYLCRISDAS
jgi:hypothetical protein